MLELAQGNDLLKAVVSATHGADTELLPLLTTHSESLLDAAKDVVAERVSAYAVPLDAERLDPAIDMVVRVVLSHVMQPSALTGGDLGGPRVDRVPGAAGLIDARTTAGFSGGDACCRRCSRAAAPRSRKRRRPTTPTWPSSRSDWTTTTPRPTAPLHDELEGASPDEMGDLFSRVTIEGADRLDVPAGRGVVVVRPGGGARGAPGADRRVGRDGGRGPGDGRGHGRAELRQLGGLEPRPAYVAAEERVDRACSALQDLADDAGADLDLCVGMFAPPGTG